MFDYTSFLKNTQIKSKNCAVEGKSQPPPPCFCYVLALNVFNLHAITRMIVREKTYFNDIFLDPLLNHVNSGDYLAIKTKAAPSSVDLSH